MSETATVLSRAGMMGGVRRVLQSELLRSSAVYTVTAVIASAIPFLLMPVLTRYLTPADYGTVAMFTVMVGVVGPFVGLSLHGAIRVRYFSGSEAELPRYVGNCMLLLLASTGAIGLVLALFSGPISELTTIPRRWLWAVVAVSFGQFVSLSQLALWQVRERPVHYGIFQVGQAALNAGLSLLLVVGLGMRWQGRISAQVAVALGGGVVALCLLRRSGSLVLEISRKDLRNALRFGLPLIPHSIGGMLITQTDRVFLTNMANVAETGIYAVAFQLTMILGLLTQSFNSGYVPWLYRRLSMNTREAKQGVVRLTYFYFGGMLVCAVGLALALPPFMSFFVGEGFAGAERYTPWLALGLAFQGMYYMVANYIFYVGSTYLISAVTFVTALCNIVFNYLFIRLNGPVGAAQATALAMLMSFLLTWGLSMRVYAMPWRLGSQ